MIKRNQKMEIIKIETEFIKLDQLLKWADIVSSGAEAKELILEGRVKVNGETEIRRGKKIKEGDIVEFEKRFVKIVK
jgi:ribosome-associated protein